MKCEMCDRPATVHPTTVIAGQRVETHLCETCASRLDAQDPRHARALEQASAIRAMQPSRAEPPHTCEGCGSKPTVYVRENHLGKQTAHHLCEQCYGLQLSDPDEKADYDRRIKRSEWSRRFGQIMEDADTQFGGLDPKTAETWSPWLRKRLAEIEHLSPRTNKQRTEEPL